MPKDFENQCSRSHLTMEERATIASMLNQKKSVRSIASTLQRPVSTISREIARNIHNYPYEKKPPCIYDHKCSVRRLCKDCNKFCMLCPDCVNYCDKYIPQQCSKRKKQPLEICNACKNFNMCKKDKAKYETKHAEKLSRERLIKTRSVSCLTEEDIKAIDEILSPLILNGQSPYAALQALKERVHVSESTLRRHINNCDLSVRRIDLRDAVKRKPRKKPAREMKNEKMSPNKTGHLWEDFLKEVKDNGLPYVQMDCVEGTKTDDKVLLTLHFPDLRLQLAFILDCHTSKCVVDTLDLIEISLGGELFKFVFPYILTDNGHEFMDIKGMEKSVFGGKRTKVYFCEANRSDEKAHCETNHKMIRTVIPKGNSLENLVQPQITLMMNHINSYPRKALRGKSAYDMADGILPKEFFEILGLEQIPYDKIILKPCLLGKI